MNWFANLGFGGAGSNTTAQGTGNSNAGPTGTAQGSQQGAQPGAAATGTNSAPPGPQQTTTPTPEDNLRSFNAMLTKGAEVMKQSAPSETKSVYAHLTQESIDGALAQASFSSLVKPETFTAIVGPNNPEGAQMLAGLLDTMYRKVLATAATGAMRLSEFGLTETMKQFKDGELQSLIGTTLTRAQLQESNPLASNPLFQPAIEAAIAGLKAQNPTVPHNAIVEHVNKMFMALGNSQLGAPGTQQTQQQPNSNSAAFLAKPVTEFNDDFFAHLQAMK